MANHTLRSNYHKSFETGITASTTQTQGNGALTAAINEISTVANDGDTVTLPVAVEGFETAVINNGANALQIFPASGDNLGNGLNISVSLEMNEEIKFFGIGGTSYHIEDTTEIFHGEMHDTKNTAEYVIHSANEEHAYHSAAVHLGDLAGWDFNAGSAGTAIVISAIADNGGVVAGTVLVTTNTAHGYAVGDTICHTGLTDANYVGFFTVLTVPTTTTYTVTATWGATGTGFTEQPAYIAIQDIAVGTYALFWNMTLAVIGNGITIDFFMRSSTGVVEGSDGRHKIASAANFKMVGGHGIVKATSGVRIFITYTNLSDATNFVIRNASIIAIKL